MRFRPTFLRTFAAITVFAAALFMPALKSAAQENLPKPVEVWKNAKEAWNNTNSYTANLFYWGYATDYFNKNFPEHWRKVEGKPKEPDHETWVYRIYGIAYKDKRLILSYDYSQKEYTEEGTLINRAIAYVLKYAPGTLMQFGVSPEGKLTWDTSDTVYIKFPYLGTKEIAKMPIPLIWKGPIQILMLASKKEIYTEKIGNLKDSRGNTIKHLAIGETMKRFEPYLDLYAKGDPSVSIEIRRSALMDQNDYEINDETGWLTEKAIPSSRPKDMLTITFVDKDLKRSRGVTKIEAFVLPNTWAFQGMKEWENNKLVAVMHFQDLKINPKVEDALWTDFFKGRKISDTTRD